MVTSPTFSLRHSNNKTKSPAFPWKELVPTSGASNHLTLITSRDQHSAVLKDWIKQTKQFSNQYSPPPFQHRGKRQKCPSPTLYLRGICLNTFTASEVPVVLLIISLHVGAKWDLPENLEKAGNYVPHCLCQLTPAVKLSLQL